MHRPCSGVKSCTSRKDHISLDKCKHVVWIYMTLLFWNFLQKILLPLTASSQHYSGVTTVFYNTATIAYSVAVIPLIRWKMDRCHLSVSGLNPKTAACGEVTFALHSAANEQFNHGVLYTAKLLELFSLLPLTPPLSTELFIHQRQQIHLKPTQQRCKTMLPCPSPVWKES